MPYQDKKALKRAARLRNQQKRSGERVAPLEVWLNRVEDAGRLDPTGTFPCRNCGHAIPWDGGGTGHRNHCPVCLHSVHLDDEPGDRAADCGGVMDPVAVWVRRGGEWAVIHRCRDCGRLSSNRIAADDDPAVLLSLAVRPLAQPPFPLERIGQKNDAP